METKSFVTLDKDGVVSPSAKAYVYNHGTEDLAQIFSRGGTSLNNPVTSNDNGYFEFSANNGDYDVQFEVSGVKGKKIRIVFSDSKETVKFVSKNTSDIAQAAADIATNKTKIEGLPSAVKTDFAQPEGLSLIGTVSNFDTLRTLIPVYDGARVMVRSYYSGKGKGGGIFVGHTGTQIDDGGFIAAGSGFYWVREDLNLNNLTVLEFGAYADGVNDDQPAVKRMYEFTLSKYARLLSGATQSGNTLSGGRSIQLPVRFATGTYLIKPGVYTTYGNKVPDGASDAGQNPSGYYAAGDFKLEGPFTQSGRQASVRIISDKTDSHVFLINHRRLTVHGIVWDGQQTVAQDETTKMIKGANTITDTVNLVSNKQPFLKNQCPAGQYANITSVQINNTGGVGFDLQDTLDTTIAQIFSSKPALPAIQVTWSDPNNQFYGKWDHSTAIKLMDCNFQNFMTVGVWIPRCAQSLMENAWFEHGYCPFDINNGQWIMNTVCIEDCAKNGIAWNSKFVLTNESVPTGNKVDGDSGPSSADWGSFKTNPDGSDVTAWINGYEVGYAVIQTHGTYLNQPLRYKWLSGIIRGTNNVNSNLWVNIGSLQTPAVGGVWEFEVIASGYLSAGTTPLSVTGDRSTGKTIITVQRGSGSSPKVMYYHQGMSAVKAVKYTPQYNDGIQNLWVQLDTYTGEYSITAKSTGVTRRESGQPSLFTLSGATQTGTPSGTTDAIARFSLHNGRAGVGGQDDMLAINTANINSSDVYVDTFVQYQKLIFNGVIRAMPIFALRPVINTQPTAQSVAAGGTLTLSVVATYTKTSGSWDTYQWYKDGVAISGATSATYTKASVTSDDAGQYKVQVRGDAAVGNARDSNAVAVTIT
ncbi:hypothetical protein [Erwinia phage FBB1]|nr:hypothetical protein [Erwinia phage FBB1]